MDPINRYSLEEFAERHRTDFDLHEPRPALWELVATQLAQEHAELPPMSIVAEAPPLPPGQPVPPARGQYAGIAAALAALVAAAGLGEYWKTHHPAALATQAASADTHRAGPDAALYLGADSSVLAASQGGPNGNARLDTAVHGMERYYAAQLQDRRTQLSQLAPASQAEWALQLVSLDSSYQQLKRELPQHPQPEVVLTAMNRNLQIRLDILDRQLELRGGDRQLAQGPSPLGASEYALADSRSVADNATLPHAR